MEKLTRRSMLAAVPACGLAPIVPAMAAPGENELPVTKVNRLAKELSHAMDDWCADMAVDGAPDVWKAHVYPSRHLQYPVMFEHIGSHDEVVAESAQTEVEELFVKWLAVANGPRDPAEDDNWGESRYVRLQASILAAEPTSPRDIAIQFFVDCDQFDSDFSDHWESLVKRLIGSVA